MSNEGGIASSTIYSSTATALESAAASGKEDLVKLLIQNGADVNDANAFGWTPIMQAARYGHSSVVMAFLSTSADVTHSTKLGTSVLSTAVASNDTATVVIVLEALLKQRDVSAVDDPLPLAVAALNGNLSLVSLLVDKGFNPGTAVPVTGLTPLMMAACNGHYSVADWLLNKGVNPNAVSALCQTALDIAATKGYRDIQTLLMKKMDVQVASPVTNCSESTHSPFTWTCMGNHIQVENIFDPLSEEKEKMLHFPKNCDLRTKLSPFYVPSMDCHYQQPNVFPCKPLIGRSHCCQKNCGSASPLPACAFTTKYCHLSPYLHHRRIVNFRTPPPHSCLCKDEHHGQEYHQKWNRRMSKSDPDLLKKDNNSLTRWWKVATGKLNSKVKSKKKAFVKSKIVKSLKFGSDNCQNACEDKADGQASGHMINKGEHPSRNSVFSTSPEVKISEVEDFLLLCGLQEYVHIFIKHEIDLQTLYSLTVEDLEEMGIVNPTKQIRILKSIMIRKRK